MNHCKIFIYSTISMAFLLFNSLESAEKQAVPESMTRLRYESLTGLKGTYNENEQVFKSLLPRTDNRFFFESTSLDQFLDLVSWVSFTPTGSDQFLMVGELVLFQDEVNPIISILINNGIDISALDNHFFLDNPKVFFLNICGKNSLPVLGKAIKLVRESIKIFRQKNPQVLNPNRGKINWSTSSLNPASLDKLFGFKGEYKEGMLKYKFNQETNSEGIILGPDMGIYSWLALGGQNENAIANGDLAIPEAELSKVLKILIDGGFNILSIHNHLIKESPRLIFIHFFGRGKALDLAKTIKETMNDE